MGNNKAVSLSLSILRTYTHLVALAGAITSNIMTALNGTERGASILVFRRQCVNLKIIARHYDVRSNRLCLSHNGKWGQNGQLIYERAQPQFPPSALSRLLHAWPLHYDLIPNKPCGIRRRIYANESRACEIRYVGGRAGRKKLIYIQPCRLAVALVYTIYCDIQLIKLH